MIRRKSASSLVFRHIGDPQRPCIVDHRAEQAEAPGGRADPAASLLIDSHRDELGQTGSLLVQDPEGAVSSVRELDSDLDDSVEDRSQIQFRAERYNRFEKPAPAPWTDMLRPH